MVSSQWLKDNIEQPKLIVLYTQMNNPVTGQSDSSPGGYIPNSINLPFQLCLEGTTLKSSTELKTIFSEWVLTLDKSLVFSCGSGVTACILALAATEAGYTKLAVYDGSWSEWGASADLPVEL
nr:rhodanese-like domain-containing protein [Paraglaciecola sp. MB-3u-78]